MAGVEMTYSTSVTPKADALEKPFWTDSRRSLNLVTGSQSCPMRATQNHTRGLLPVGAKTRNRLCREPVTSGGNLGVSESSRSAQIELAEISLRGCLLDACAPSIGTPRHHSCKTVRVLVKRNGSTQVSGIFQNFASSACPTHGYRWSWMTRSRRRVSHGSRMKQTRN